MAGGTANVASGVVTIDALLGNFKWNSLNLTYNFPDAASYYNAEHLLHRRSAERADLRLRKLRAGDAVAAERDHACDHHRS